MKQAHLGPAEGKNGQSEDEALQKARKIAKALIDDEGLLNTLAKVGIAPEELAAFVESIGK